MVSHIDLEQQLAWVIGKGRLMRGVSFGAKTTPTIDRYLRAHKKRKQATVATSSAWASGNPTRWSTATGPQPPTSGHGRPQEDQLRGPALAKE